jgi:hypothetical protein
LNAFEAILDRIERGDASESERAAVWFLRRVLPGRFPELCEYEQRLWLTALGEDLSQRRPEFARKHLPALRRIADDNSAPKGARKLCERLLKAMEGDR